MRLKILGLMALVALVAAMGTIGLKSQRADAAVTAFTLTGGSGGVFQWTATLTADETDAFTLSIASILPSGATAAFGATCTVSPVDAAGTCSGTAAAGPPATFTFSVANAAALDANTVPGTATVSGTLTITNAPIGTNIIVLETPAAGVAVSVTGVVDTAGAPGCGLSPDPATISVCKVDQRGTKIAATFALQGPSFLANMVTGSTTGTAGCTTALTVGGLCTVASSPSANPCRSSWECTRVLQNGIVSANPSLGIATLPAGVYTLTEATAGGYGCTQIQITNGLGQVMPPGQPITVTLPTTNVALVSFTFTNSCLLPGGPNGTGSSIVTVIGGSTFGLTNTTNVEINPAAGSDDDARIDIRIRDSNNIPLPSAHVFVMTDKGRLAVRQDLTGPTIVGYDVVEPSAPNFGLNASGDSCDQVVASQIIPVTGYPQVVAPAFAAGFLNPYLGNPSQAIGDGFTNFDGMISACLFVNDSLVPGITPGKANITVIVEAPNQFFGVGYLGGGAGNLVLTSVLTVVGPPASIKVSASPTTLQCGEKATITATITDAVGQNVSDHTRVELVSNFGSTIGGTGSTLGFPGVGAVNPVSSSAAETFSGVATAFLLTSTEHVGPYEVVVASGGSTGGVFNPGSQYLFNGSNVNAFGTPTLLGGVNFPLISPPVVNGSGGVFSTAPVSAQATVTCSLPVAAAPIGIGIPPIVAPRTGEGIRPPNTGDAGLADTSLIANID